MSHHIDHSKPVPEGSVLAVSSWDSTRDAIFFFCPACKGIHQVTIDPAHPNDAGASWSWNGDYIKPTIKPSILVHGFKSENPEFKGQPRCHSFVIDGNIIYCSDCDHGMAGKSVPLTAQPLEQ